MRRVPEPEGEVIVFLPPDSPVRRRGNAVGGWFRIYIGDRASGYLSGYVSEASLAA